MGVLGIGMGLMISQLGNVIQSSVEESGRSEAGGLQFTGQQLGSALGVAFIGAIVLMGLTSTFISTVENDSRISAEVSTQVGVAAGSNTNFVSSTQVESAAKHAGLDQATTAALVDDYESAQLRSLKAGLLGAALLALISLAFTRELPHDRPIPRKRPDPVIASPVTYWCGAADGSWAWDGARGSNDGIEVSAMQCEARLHPLPVAELPPPDVDGGSPRACKALGDCRAVLTHRQWCVTATRDVSPSLRTMHEVVRASGVDHRVESGVGDMLRLPVTAEYR